METFERTVNLSLFLSWQSSVPACFWLSCHWSRFWLQAYNNFWVAMTRMHNVVFGNTVYRKTRFTGSVVFYPTLILVFQKWSEECLQKLWHLSHCAFCSTFLRGAWAGLVIFRQFSKIFYKLFYFFWLLL